MLQRLHQAEERWEQIQADLQNPEITVDVSQLQRLGKLSADLEPIILTYRKWKKTKEDLEGAEQLLSDPEFKEVAQSEAAELRECLAQLEQQLRIMLLPKDPNDDKSVIMEIKPGTGGEEAALFAADLMRMYLRFAERQGWKFEVLDVEETSIGGISSATFSINAKGAYSLLKHEAGVHRVQRVPKTEASGRIHTSAASVVVMPEAEDVDVEIKPEELEIDTYRAGGAGGQHVNKTESAVRIKHKPTGVIVTCQDERSQMQNREKALRMLRAKLYDLKMQELATSQSQMRRKSIGSGDRSEKIRTYNFPDRRITDHRIGFSSFNLAEFMDGDIKDMLDALVAEEQARLLAEEEPDSNH